MDEFLELGIEGTDKLVDLHFDKIPDAALHAHTYHPKNLSKSLRRRRKKDAAAQDPANKSPSPDSAQSDPPPPTSRGAPFDMSRQGQGPPDPVYPNPPIYSNEPPRMRAEYVPTPPPIGQDNTPYPVGPPLYQQDYNNRSSMRARGRDRDDDYYGDGYDYGDGYTNPPRRPRPTRRRSSSYHGPRRDDSSDGRSPSPDNRQLARRSRRGSVGTAQKDRDRDRDEGSKGHDFKEEIEKHFTKTPAGVTGGVIGALAGAWVSRKVQHSHDGKKDPNPLVTGLGAVVGGLAVNAAIDKWEETRKEKEKAHAERQQKWEDKWHGSESDEDSPPRRRSSRRDRDDSRDDYRDSRSDYGGERGGRGYAPYR